VAVSLARDRPCAIGVGPERRACAPATLAIAEKLDPGAVNQQVQGAISTPIRDLDGQRLLPSAQGGVVGHRPTQARHLQQARYHPGRFS
jgi:hypothetical protein